MLQLENATGLAATLFLAPDPEGVDTLYAVAKGTFALDLAAGPAGAPPLAAEQRPLTLADEHYGDPLATSVRRPSDVALLKPATDVLLVGTAHAPGGRPAYAMDVRLTVGPVRKAVRVVGDRAWVRGGVGYVASEPRPFTTMPLVWERAFGGTDVVDGVPQAEGRNPVGTGFRAGPDPLDGVRLPNLEDPADPVASWTLGPAPACFAPVAPHWLPRRRHAGTYDDAWQRGRAPYLPADFDARFFQLAPEGLTAPGHLEGGEPLEVDGASAAGPVRCALPRVALDVDFALRGTLETRRAVLDTVLIEPDANRLSLVWRAALRCDKQALRVSAVLVRAAGLGAPAPAETPA